MVGSKSIMTVSTIAFALMFGGGAYILLNLNTLAKPMTERIASDALGVKVRIDTMEITLKEKRVDVHGITVANPPGYKKPHAITVDHIGVQLDTASEELIQFKNIDVNGTNAYLEVTPNGTNLQDLQTRIASAKADPDTPSTLKVIIDRIATTKAVLHPSVTLIGEQDLQPITIPNLTLTGVGAKENGVLVDEAIAQVMAPLVKSFSKAAGNAGFYQGLSADQLKAIGEDNLKATINEGVDQFKNDLQGLFE